MEICLRETSARSLVDHWSWAADKGLMNRNTAAGLSSACVRVLDILGDNWEQTESELSTSRNNSFVLKTSRKSNSGP